MNDALLGEHVSSSWYETTQAIEKFERYEVRFQEVMLRYRECTGQTASIMYLEQQELSILLEDWDYWQYRKYKRTVGGMTSTVKDYVKWLRDNDPVLLKAQIRKLQEAQEQMRWTDAITVWIQGALNAVRLKLYKICWNFQ